MMLQAFSIKKQTPTRTMKNTKNVTRSLIIALCNLTGAYLLAFSQIENSLSIGENQTPLARPEPFEESPAPYVAPGWRYPRMDAIGHSCMERGSVVRTGNEMYVINVIQNVNSVLTGDVDGDGSLDVVTCSGYTINIYDGAGNKKHSFNLQRDSYLMMLEDIDNDGMMEIFLGSYGGAGISAYIYKGNGTLLKTFVNQHNGGWDDMQIHPIAFSKGKVLVRYNAGWAGIPRGLGAFDYVTQNEVWFYQIGPICDVVSVADMDGDGNLDITLQNGTVHNGVSGNGTTDGDLYLIVVDENGNKKITRKYESPSDGVANHLFADVNRDGKLEIIGFKGHDHNYGGQSKIIIFDNNGNILKTFNGPMNRQWTGTSWRMGAYAYGDLNGDGQPEIIATAYSYSPRATTTYVLDSNLNKLAESNVDGEVRLICDINGDGYKEVVLASYTGFLRVLDHNLNQLSCYQTGVVGNDVAGDVIASDINGDGKIELLYKSDALYLIGFSKPKFDLIVKSTNPDTGVMITSFTGHGGTTEFLKQIEEGATVNLEAPFYHGSGANRKRFASWSGSTSTTNRSINFTMDTNKTLVANFVDDPETRIIRIVGDLNFGNVSVNSTNVKSLTIFNDGNMPLTVSGIICPNGFNATPQSFTLNPGESQNVAVTFSPQNQGYFFGIVTINSDKTAGVDYIACFGIAEGGVIISPQSWNAPADGGNLVVSITASGSWTISNPCSSWITVSPLSGSGSANITISTSPNNSGAERSCVLSVGGQNFVITQPARSTPGNLVSATHEVLRTSNPQTNLIKCSIYYPSDRRLNSLLWRPILPHSWSLINAYGDGSPEVFNNEIVFIGSLTSNPIQFTYVVELPEQIAQSNLISGEVEYQLDGMINPQTIRANPDPLIYIPYSYHSADYREPKWIIDGTEMNRVLSYWRNGSYYANPEGVDGYATVPGNTNAIRHNADYREPFWKIDGTEVNRVLSYWRAMGYHMDSSGLDGYAPGHPDSITLMSLKTLTVYQETSPIYIAGSTISVTNRIQYSGKLLSLLMRPILPDGWQIVSVSGNGNPELVSGEIVWTGLFNESEIFLIYTVLVPPNERLPQCIRCEIEYQMAGMVNPETIKPAVDAINVAPYKLIPGRFQGNQITLTLLGKPNALYRIEYSTDLLNWHPLTTIRVEDCEARFSEPMLSQFRFYRIMPQD